MAADVTYAATMLAVLMLAQEASADGEALPSWVVWATFVSFVAGMAIFAVSWSRARAREARSSRADGPGPE